MSHSIVTDRLRAWFTGLPLLLLLPVGRSLLAESANYSHYGNSWHKRHDPDFIVSRFVATTK